MDRPVEQIAEFEILDLLGSGGAGKVYMARHRPTGRRVALKLLRAGASERLVKRFHREARTLERLDDPNVVSLVACDLEHEPPYMAMEFIDGDSLRAVLDEARELGSGTPRPVRTLDWARDMARGLKAAHDRQVLHRDIKPQNVMIDDQQRAILVDFGLVKSKETDSVSLTASSDVVGTLLYFSPEQFDLKEVDARSDIYQWGLVVYEMIHSERPYPKLDPLAALARRADKGVGSPSCSDPGLANLNALCLRALDPSPQQRPAHGGDLLAMLDGKLREESDTIQRAARTHHHPVPTAVLDQIGRFRIIRELGRGGLGIVYEGQDPVSGERVAIKQILLDFPEHRETLKRFQREIAVMARIQHPRVVRILDSGSVASGPYLVMEYLGGVPLDRRIQTDGALGPREGLEILLNVSEGVGALHNNGVVHRDLKPANLFLARNIGPKVLDLGLAHDPGMTVLTQTGGQVGTPLYTPPEIFQGSAATKATDVYQLGLILYEILTGRRDFRSEGASDTLRGVLYRDRGQLGERPDEVVSGVMELFENATRTEPGARYRDGNAFRMQVERVMKIMDGPAPSAGALGRRTSETGSSSPRSIPGFEARATLPASKLAQGAAVLSWILHAIVATFIVAMVVVILYFLPLILRRSRL